MNACQRWTAVLIAVFLLPNVAASADAAKEAYERGQQGQGGRRLRPGQEARIQGEVKLLIKEDLGMKIFPLLLVPGFVVSWLVSSPANAKEPAPSVDSILAKWEEASTKCKTLDAKLTVWKYDYSKIDVILNAKTFLTVATQVFSPNGRDRTVFELSEPKVNQRPSDRDQLMAPNLSGLHLIENR